MNQEVVQRLRDALKNPKLVVLTDNGFGLNVIYDEKGLEFALNSMQVDGALYDSRRSFTIKELQPFKDLHEFTRAQDAHSKYICFRDYPDGLKLPIEINNKGIYVKWFDGMQFVSYDDLADRCTWQDGYPCGTICRAIEFISYQEVMDE